MKKTKRPAQIWSLDAILAVVLLSFAIIGFIVFTSSMVPQRRTAQLVQENAVLANALSAQVQDSNFTVLQDHLDETRIAQLSKMRYADIKTQLGLTTDFCIYFTDKSGNLVKKGGVYFLGAPYINISAGGCIFSCNGTLYTHTEACNWGITS